MDPIHNEALMVNEQWQQKAGGGILLCRSHRQQRASPHPVGKRLLILHAWGRSPSRTSRWPRPSRSVALPQPSSFLQWAPLTQLFDGLRMAHRVTPCPVLKSRYPPCALCLLGLRWICGKKRALHPRNTPPTRSASAHGNEGGMAGRTGSTMKRRRGVRGGVFFFLSIY